MVEKNFYNINKSTSRVMIFKDKFSFAYISQHFNAVNNFKYSFKEYISLNS